MIREFSSVLNELEKNKDVDIWFRPKCPKKSDPYCLAVNGHCETGNNKQCVQKCRLFYKNSLYNFEVVFCYEKNTRLCYVNTETLMYNNFLKTGLVE